MTSEPLILPQAATVAEAWRMHATRGTDVVEFVDLHGASSQATPTGHYLGCVHLQKLLREPPSSLIGGIPT